MYGYFTLLHHQTLVFVYTWDIWFHYGNNVVIGTRLARRVSLEEQELHTLPGHPSLPSVFSGVRVTRSLVLCICFVYRYLSLCIFSFGHCVVCPSVYGFWFPLWHLNTDTKTISTLLYINCERYVFHTYSESFLCPAKIGDPSIGGSGRVFYIEILSATKTKGWDEFSTAVAKEWFDLGGIPHLAKQWPNLVESYEKFREVCLYSFWLKLSSIFNVVVGIKWKTKIPQHQNMQ